MRADGQATRPGRGQRRRTPGRRRRGWSGATQFPCGRGKERWKWEPTSAGPGQGQGQTPLSVYRLSKLSHFCGPVRGNQPAPEMVLNRLMDCAVKPRAVMKTKILPLIVFITALGTMPVSLPAAE